MTNRHSGLGRPGHPLPPLAEHRHALRAREKAGVGTEPLLVTAVVELRKNLVATLVEGAERYIARKLSADHAHLGELLAHGPGSKHVGEADRRPPAGREAAREHRARRHRLVDLDHEAVVLERLLIL